MAAAAAAEERRGEDRPALIAAESGVREEGRALITQKKNAPGTRLNTYVCVGGLHDRLFKDCIFEREKNTNI